MYLVRRLVGDQYYYMKNAKPRLRGVGDYPWWVCLWTPVREKAFRFDTRQRPENIKLFYSERDRLEVITCSQ